MAQEYPEHEKMHTVVERSQQFGEFIEWLSYAKGLSLCERRPQYHEVWVDEKGEPQEIYERAGYAPAMRGEAYLNELLAEFFDIDLHAIEREKRAMLERQRQLNKEREREQVGSTERGGQVHPWKILGRPWSLCRALLLKIGGQRTRR